jgi:hypothetical protein
MTQYHANVLASETPGIPAEVELLLLTARVELDAEASARVRALLERDPDWNRLLHLAEWHAMLPLLCSSLQTVAPQAVPEPVRRQLEAHYFANAARNLYLARVLGELLAWLGSHGIRAVPLKGIALAAGAYGNLALREVRDLDLLVSRRDVEQARQLFLARGYQPARHATGAYALETPDRTLMVELHWALTRPHFPFALDLDSVSDRLERVLVAGTPMPDFPPEELLLYLCVHAATHGWERLRWVCDVAQQLRSHPDLAWERALEQAAALGCRRMFLLGLCLARDLLGAVVPTPVAAVLHSERALVPLAAGIRARLCSSEARPVEMLEMHRIRLCVRERLRDRQPYVWYYLPRYIRAAARLNQEDQSLPLPRRLFFLAYLFRPIRLALRCTARLTRNRN